MIIAIAIAMDVGDQTAFFFFFYLLYLELGFIIRSLPNGS